MAYTYSKIASVTVGSGGVSSIDFLAIPQNYTDLVIKVSARSTRSAGQDQIDMRFNSSSSGYSYRQLIGDGTTVVSANASGSFVYSGVAPASTGTTNTFGNFEVYIPNYATDKYKSVSADYVNEGNATTVYYQGFTAGLWSNSSPINSISFYSDNAANFAQYSTITLYGIKAEV